MGEEEGENRRWRLAGCKDRWFVCFVARRCFFVCLFTHHIAERDCRVSCTEMVQPFGISGEEVAMLNLGPPAMPSRQEL